MIRPFGFNRTLAAGNEQQGMRLLAGFESSVEGLGGRGASGLIASLPLTLVYRAVAAASAAASNFIPGGLGPGVPDDFDRPEN